MRYCRLVITIGISLFLLACTTGTEHRGSVSDVWHKSSKAPEFYIVKHGETLYSIAWRYGLDYRQIANLNKIMPPYKIHSGQRLRLKTRKTAVSASKASPAIAPAPQVETSLKMPLTTPPLVASEQAANQLTLNDELNAPPRVIATAGKIQILPVKTMQNEGIAWAWPAQGKIITGFSPNGFSKGIDIAGQNGDPIVAAASGKVVYCGSGLRGYGNLIIIKHNDEFLTAYAHNQKLLVREGQNIQVGQVIARMGDTEAKTTMLHFEIRRAGKPVDPLRYLQGH